jgi:hypothetical protein
MNATRTKLSPSELGAQWGKKPATIIALIKAGELRAIDASLGSGKPRFLIDLDDIAAFERRRQVGAPRERAPKQRRSKEQLPAGFVEYF